MVALFLFLPYGVPDLGYRRAEENTQEPIRSDLSPVPGALELGQVDRPPEKSGQETGKANAHDLVDSKLAAQLHELPQGPVLELLQLIGPPVYGGEDVPSQNMAFLNRRLCGGRDELSFPVGNRRAITDGPHARAVRHPQVAVHDHPIAFGQGEI